MTGRQKSLHGASLQTELIAKKVGVTSGTLEVKEVLGAERRKKVVEQVRHTLQHPRPVINSPSKRKRPGNLVSKVILQVFCL